MSLNKLIEIVIDFFVFFSYLGGKNIICVKYIKSYFGFGSGVVMLRDECV